MAIIITNENLKKYHGQKISKELFENIKSNYRISKHAQEQLEKRSDLLIKYEGGSINFGATKAAINEAMNKNILAYINTDGSVNVALDKYHYFVFAYNEDHKNWTMITYKEPSWYDKDIFEKQKMALDGFDRKYK